MLRTRGGGEGDPAGGGGAVGSIYLEVEDDGTPTGLHANHADLSGLAALVANRTVPPVTVRVSRLDMAGVTVACIKVPRSVQITATSDGVFKRRRLQLDGRPECVPFLPHEFDQRLAQLGLTDPSSQAVAGATLADLDPVERARKYGRKCGRARKYGRPARSLAAIGREPCRPIAGDHLCEAANTPRGSPVDRTEDGR